MKKIIFLMFTVLMFTACQKEDPLTPADPPTENTSNWSDDYIDGGTIPNGTPVENDLVGTTWVLTKYVTQMTTEYPNDTINFVSNTTYTMNGGAVRNYQLSNIPASTNKDLTLYYFFPFGGSHYSGQVGLYFVDDGQISNVEFSDIQNSTNSVQAWFVKI
jgi:hypothetical protein